MEWHHFLLTTAKSGRTVDLFLSTFIENVIMLCFMFKLDTNILGHAHYGYIYIFLLL